MEIFKILFGFIFSVFAAKLLTVFPLLIDDLIRVFKYIIKLFNENESSFSGEKINRLDFFKRSAMVLGAFAFTTLAYGIIVGRFNFKKHFIDLKLNSFKGKHPLKIVQISDLHLGSFQRLDKLTEAVDLINEEKPDLIFFTGDLVNNHADEAYPFIDTLSKLKANYGKFSVLGNHDYGDYTSWDSEVDKIENFNKLKKTQNEMGFQLLLNESITIRKNNSKIDLIGVEN